MQNSMLSLITIYNKLNNLISKIKNGLKKPVFLLIKLTLSTKLNKF